MGEVITFVPKMKPALWRMLVVHDAPIRKAELAGAVAYVKPRMSGPLGIEHQYQCLTCRLRADEPDPASILKYFANTKKIRIIAVLCLMQKPPRAELEEIFRHAALFFEPPHMIASLA